MTVFRMSGDVGQAEMSALSGSLESALESGVRCFVLQMDAVEHIDYRSLDPLNRCSSRLRSCGAEMRIAGASRYIRNILKFVGVEQQFRVQGTLAEAVLSFAMTRSPAAISEQYCEVAGAKAGRYSVARCEGR
ncbi:MAG: STAS domain-containing protein [Myxococcota bacterium]